MRGLEFTCPLAHSEEPGPLEPRLKHKEVQVKKWLIPKGM